MATTERLRAPVPTNDLERGLADLAAYGYAIHANFVDDEMLTRLGERIEEQAACERALQVAEYSRRNSDSRRCADGVVLSQQGTGVHRPAASSARRGVRGGGAGLAHVPGVLTGRDDRAAAGRRHSG